MESIAEEDEFGEEELKDLVQTLFLKVQSTMDKKIAADLHGAPIGVMGSGDYGRAFTARLVSASLPVVIGSRSPAGKELFLGQVQPELRGVSVVSIREMLAKCNPVVLAIDAKDHEDLKNYEQLLDGKIVVDVSNPEGDSSVKSQAESLQEMLPRSRVVKAFNTVSAYSLNEQGTSGEITSVCVCSDDADARREVIELATTMGLAALDMGGLVSARAQERSMQTLFPGWGKALLMTLFWFAFWFLFCTIRNGLRENAKWDSLATTIMNKVAACMAMTLLAMCYVPGCIVAIVQLIRGTKYEALPQWLCCLMKMRKQVGLIGLFFALVHVCLSLTIIQPAHMSSWFQFKSVIIPANHTEDITLPLSSRLTWVAETTILLGTLAVALYCILGISSLPSVSRSFNWREWNFTYTWLGLLCLVLSCAHVVVKSHKGWGRIGLERSLKGPSLVSLLIPFLVLAVRLIMLLPCVHIRLNNIRRGRIYGADQELARVVVNSESNSPAAQTNESTFDNPSVEVIDAATHI